MTDDIHPTTDQARTGQPQRMALDPLVDAIASPIWQCLSRLVWTVGAWGLAMVLVVVLAVIGWG